MSLKKAAECVRKHKSFLITTHTSPEGDALGSELAFYRLLRKLGKSALIINEDDVPYCYGFLPDIEEITKFRKNMNALKFDCFAVLDCSDLARPGHVRELNLENAPILNMDHHISNTMFGDVNWIEPQASCCSEMIFKLYKEFRLPIDPDAALSMYVGIFTDTGSFRYSNTTAFTHRAASELLLHDIDVRRTYSNIYENIPFQDIKLLTKILPTVKRASGGKIVWFELKRAILKRALSFDLVDSLLTFARSIRGVEAAVLFKENLGVRNEVGVNLRSQGKVDVNKVASYFGGGGHKTASGCTIKGNIEKARKIVLSKIAEGL